jgi:glycosyltransferase involved in cell wall biosynthesis
MHRCSLDRINPGLKKLVNTEDNTSPLLAPQVPSDTERLKVARDRLSRIASQDRPPHVVIIIENMTVPPDRRVWQQACSLRDEGWRVSVISPQVGSFRTPRETLEGIEIYRHPLMIEARNIAGYAVEYATALLFESIGLIRIGLGAVDVVQICNPPDFLFAPALLAKKFGNAKVIFDHHDLTPELLVQKTGVEESLLLNFARWAERQTFSVADRVISTNASFREHALQVSDKNEDEVCVVYSGPDLEMLKPGRIDPALKKGKDILLFWIGVIGSQDGVDLLLDAMVRLKELPGGDRFHLQIAGDGTERGVMQERACQLGLEDTVTFAGFLHSDDLANAFATADIGIGSDPKNSFNDRLAMNKVMEYMAYCLPIVMFDLAECRKIAGEGALYATNNDPGALAAHLSNLIEAPATRKFRGEKGRARLEGEFAWEHQKERYLDVYRSLFERA